MSDETVTEKRGPGRPPKSEGVHKVTYIPRDPGDPMEITCYDGQKFMANIPRDIKENETYLVPMRQESTNADGNVVYKYPERKRSIVEAARQNPYFSVDGEPPIKPLKGRMRLPDDPDHYRGWARSWISLSTNLEALDARWEAEELLREKCGVNEDELRDLAPLLEIKRAQLADA